MDAVKDNVRAAAEALRMSAMPTKPIPKKCASCDYRGMCTEGAKAAAQVDKKGA